MKKNYSILFFWPRSMWDLSSRSAIEPVTPAGEVWSLNHWTTREVPKKPKVLDHRS